MDSFWVHVHEVGENPDFCDTEEPRFWHYCMVNGLGRMVMMALGEHLQCFYNVLADQVLEWLDADMQLAAALGVKAPHALTANYAPLQAAINAIKSRMPLANEMRRAEWADVPLQIRNRAQFNAGVTSARIVQRIQERMERELQWRVGDGIGRDTFVREMCRVMQAEGMEVKPDGNLTDITSNARLELIHDMQTRSARNFSKWKIDQDPALLAAASAQELVRVRHSAVPRDWYARWSQAGGVVRGGRMVAHKLDPIWLKISRFGQPWPPFDYNSGMGVIDVLEADAQALGVVAPPPEEQVYENGFNTMVETEITELLEGEIAWIKERLGDQVSMVDGKLRLTPLAWSSVKDANQWAARAYASMQVAADEVAAMTAYQDRRTGLYAKVTRWLREKQEGSKPDEAVLRQMEALDRVIERSHAAESGICWHCVDIADDGTFDYGDASYMSTSLSSAYAWKNYGKKAREPMIVKIYLPKGSKGVYLSQFTADNPDKQEGEFLLRRGTLLRQASARWIELDGRRVREICTFAEQMGNPANLRWRRPDERD